MNKIVIELCAEDRARLDRLAEALERKACEPCATPVVEEPKPNTEPQASPSEEVPIQSEPTKTVARTDLRAKVIELSAKGFKEQTRDIVRAYAPTVTAVPEDKLAECYDKLVALEG